MEKTRYIIKDLPFVPTHMGQMSKVSEFDVFDTKFDKEVKDKILKYYDGEMIEDISVGECEYTHQKIMPFRNPKEIANLKSFQFFLIECAEETDIVLVPRSTAFQKVWVNFKFFSYLKKFDITYIVHLNKGKNIIVFESGDVIKWHSLFVRVSAYSYEQKTQTSCIFGKLKYPLDLGYTHYYANRFYGPYKRFSFAFYPNNDVMTNKAAMADIKITQIFSNSKKIVYRDKVAPLTKHTYDLSDLAKTGNKFHYFVFELEYTYTNGIVHKDRMEIYTTPFERYKNYLLKKAEKALLNTNLHPFDSTCIEYYINEIKTNASSEEHLIKLKNELRRLNQKRSFEIISKSPGAHKLFYKSKLSEEIMNTTVCVPFDYTDSKKYPLIVIFHTHNVLSAEFFENYCDEPIIAADINLQGINLGSYIGEACFKEVLQIIKENYTIDENRIYLTGYSNGGGAAYLLAEACPGDYAGIHPMSAGGINISLAKNLVNIPIISVSSTNDNRLPIFKEAEKAFYECNHPNYEGYLAEEYSHISMGTLYLNEQIFKKLLSYQREEYPDTIRFRTHRNRHNKAYWIQLHSIEHSEKYAEISANICDNNIYIQLKNSTGITITLPPQIHRFRFNIIINDTQIFRFYEYNKDCIHFLKENDTYIIKEQTTNITNYHKGNGLLDVYLEPLCIVKPNTEDDDYCKLANNFSNPSTNGYDTQIYVNYPIKTYKDFAELQFNKDKCLIVIDNLMNNNYLKKIRTQATVKTTQKGYTYLNTKYSGKYCIMQIVDNPYNNKKILLITANDKKLIQDNIFTRKVFMPTYVGNHNPYWNNEVLIFDGDSYYGIFERGMKIEKITNQ